MMKEFDEKNYYIYIYINELKPEFLAIIKLNENYFKI